MQTGEIKKTTSIEFENGDKYEGEFENGLRNGKGAMIYANGDICVGDFKDGLIHGIGSMQYAIGMTYYGEFKGGLPDGEGAMTFSSGDAYTGEFQDGKLHGKGVLTFSSGNIYNGDFKDGLIHGIGSMQYASGNTYKGEFENGLRNGIGMLTFKNGAIYHGEFKDGDTFIDTAKPKSENKTKTLVFQSSEMQSEESEKWGYGRFTNEDESTTRHCNINNANEVIVKLNELAEVNEDKSTEFKLVFHQHGGIYGWNNIGVDAESARQMLEILSKKGYRDITVSDLSCHGGTASHFKRISQEFADQDPDINVTIRASAEGRSVISCNSNNGTKFRTLDTNGEAQKREKTVYNTYDEGERKNAGCLAQKLLKSKQPHPSYKRLETNQRNQSTDYNLI